MPIDLPNLDDRTYADLADEARASIPALYPAWTDHNPSDPGVTLIELFAWLTEAVLYRTNQIPEKTYEAFLKTLGGPGWERGAGEALDDAIARTIGALREPYRAVTGADYERLVKKAWPAVARVHCLPERDLEPYVGAIRMPGEVSVIVMPPPEGPAAPWDQPSPALLQAVKSFLNDRRILTTRLHVVGPFFASVPLTATLFLKDGSDRDAVVLEAQAALRANFDPFTGGAAGEGWPLGRDVYTSDVYTLLEGVRGVDFVKDVDFPVPPLPPRRILNDAGEIVGVTVLEHELVKLELDETSISTRERRGELWLA